MKNCLIPTLLLVFLIFIDLSGSTLSQSDKTVKNKDKNNNNKDKSAKEIIIKSGKTSKSVYMKNLVTTNIASKNDILQNYKSYHEDFNFNNFDNLVLGYVTPWNNHGYDIAKRYGSPKLNLISPVWLQVKPTNEGYTIEGLHDKDPKWMNAVKKVGSKILPRHSVEIS